jgi:dienelactone hydrolase
MATPTLSHHRLPGALGEILVDVRAGSRTSPQPAVLLIHGFKGFKDYAFIPVFADHLARAGFSAVTATVSGAGVDADGNFSYPERFAHNTYSRELDDLGVVVRAINAGELGFAVPTSLGILGHSRGGGIALLLANETPSVSAIVTWNAISTVRRHSDEELAAWQKLGRIHITHKRLRIKLPMDYEVVEDCLRHEHGRQDIRGAAQQLTRPWLQVHGREDETVPFHEGEALSTLGGGSHQFLAIAGGNHGFGTVHPWSGSTHQMDTVFAASSRFLGQHLP